LAIDKVGLVRADGSNRLEADELRRILRGVASEGTLKSGDLAVTQNGTPNMSVNVAAGEAFVEGDSSTAQGLYYVRNNATVNLAISQASSTNPRKDIVILEVLDSDYTGSSDLGQLRVVAGTPGASPSPPATPVSSLKLAEITVPQSASSIVSANIGTGFGIRYRSTNVDHQWIVNDEPNTGNGIIGSNVTIASGTILKPAGWVQYDVHFHGKVVYEVQAAAGTQNRFTTSTQAPSGQQISPGRVSLLGETTGVSVFDTDVIDATATGQTADLTFRYQATVTRGGGGNYTVRYIAATLNRTR